MNTGWIKIDRAITEHWIFDDPWKFRAWIDLLLLANHEDKLVNIDNVVYNCGRGELLRSYDSLARRWRVERSKIRRFLLLLQDHDMLRIKNEKKTTRISICKYESYQGERNTNEPQMKRKRNANETQVNTNKNEKNVNNDKNIIYGPSDFLNDLISIGIEENLANDVIEHRKKSKGIFTKRSFQGLKKELDIFVETEKQPYSSALTWLIEKTTWRTFTYEYYSNKLNFHKSKNEHEYKQIKEFGELDSKWNIQNGFNPD